jgi:hypothetical protein
LAPGASSSSASERVTILRPGDTMQVVAARPVVALAARRVVALARRAAGIIAVPTIDSGQREHAHPTSTAPEYPPPRESFYTVCAQTGTRGQVREWLELV